VYITKQEGIVQYLTLSGCYPLPSTNTFSVTVGK
jgi:hypothetical protein